MREEPKHCGTVVSGLRFIQLTLPGIGKMAIKPPTAILQQSITPVL
jgi:hypothetical protein